MGAILYESETSQSKERLRQCKNKSGEEIIVYQEFMFLPFISSFVP